MIPYSTARRMLRRFLFSFLTWTEKGWQDVLEGRHPGTYTRFSIQRHIPIPMEGFSFVGLWEAQHCGRHKFIDSLVLGGGKHKFYGCIVLYSKILMK